MVLVTMCWYVDRQIQSTGGKWKVVTFPILSALKIEGGRYELFDVSQGVNTVRVLPPPEELVFTVDERVRSDISRAKKQYFESVSPFGER